MSTIMIVEDDVIIRNGLTQIVEDIDAYFKIFQTGFAKEALDYATANKIDVFFLDIQLLDYSGYELAKQIRAIDHYQLTPIVFITGVHTKEMDAYRNIHCYSFIYKPFSDADVKKVFEEIQNGIKTMDAVKHIKLKEKECTYIFNEEDIIYIEVSNRKLIVKSIYEEASFSYCSIMKIAKQLSGNFIQCHKSFLVNKKYIKKIDRFHNIIEVQALDYPIPLGRKFKDEIGRIIL